MQGGDAAPCGEKLDFMYRRLQNSDNGAYIEVILRLASPACITPTSEPQIMSIYSPLAPKPTRE